MQHEEPMAVLSRLSASSLGVFRGTTALGHGVSRKQLGRLRAIGVIERMHADTYRLIAVAPTNEQALRGALLWAGDGAAAAGRSAGELYRLEGVRALQPEIAIARAVRGTSPGVSVLHSDDRTALMVRTVRGVRVTGVEATLVRLAHLLDEEAFEIACEDARRRRLTSVPALRAYLDRFGRRGRPGMAPLRRLLEELDPDHAARSTLEVKARRLLVAYGIRGFIREFPLEWNGRAYRYDFAVPDQRVILETNGRRWHDDPRDYEHDNARWTVPGRLGFRIVFATWEKVVRDPIALLRELRATMTAL